MIIIHEHVICYCYEYKNYKTKNKNNTENMYINQKCNCKIKIIVIIYHLKKTSLGYSSSSYILKFCKGEITLRKKKQFRYFYTKYACSNGVQFSLINEIFLCWEK